MGGKAVEIFEEVYMQRRGFIPLIQTPDAVNLNRALKAAGSEDAYRSLCDFYLRREDRFLESNGYAGRMVTAPIINAWRIASSRNTIAAQSSSDYVSRLAQWQSESGLSGPLSPLPGGGE